MAATDQDFVALGFQPAAAAPQPDAFAKLGFQPSAPAVSDNDQVAAINKLPPGPQWDAAWAAASPAAKAKVTEMASAPPSFMDNARALVNQLVGSHYQQAADAAGAMAPDVIRYGTPIAAGIATGGMGLIPAAMATAGAGVAGGMSANMMEGKAAVQSPSELGVNAVSGMAGMIPAATEADVLQRLLGGASEGMAIPAAQAAAQGRAPTMKELAIGAAVGAAGRGAEGLMHSKGGDVAPDPAEAATGQGNSQSGGLTDQDAQNIQQIAKATGRDPAAVQADYMAERGIKPAAAAAPQLTSLPDSSGGGYHSQTSLPQEIIQDGAPSTAQQAAATFTANPDSLPRPVLHSAEQSARVFMQAQDPVREAQFQQAMMEQAPAEIKASILNHQLTWDPQNIQRIQEDMASGANADEASMRATTEAAANLASTLPETTKLSPQAQRWLDQTGGSIDPAVLKAVARTTVGAGLGYMTGDTDEERLRNAIIGGGIALGLPIVGQVLAKTAYGAEVMDAVAQEKQNFWKQVDPLVLLPSKITDQAGAVTPFRDLVRDEIQAGSNAIKGIQYQGAAIAKDLQASIADNASAAQSQDQIKDRVYRYLTGDAATKMAVGPQLPADVYGQTLRSRYFIDELSDKAVADGAVTGTMAQTFLSNKGQYLRRSYELFQNPNFVVDEADRQAAIDATHTQMTASTPAGGTPPARADAEAVINTLLNKQTAEPFLTGSSKVAGKDVSVLMQRQDLLPEVKTMMGEIRDPVYSVNESVGRMARLIENDRVQKSIADLGRQSGLFSPQRTGKFITPLASDGSKGFSSMAGLYAEPHIAQAFQQIAGKGNVEGLGGYIGNLLSPRGAAAQILALPNYAAKFAQTGLNVSLIVPRYLHGLFANVGNGNFRFNEQTQGLTLGAEEAGLLRKAFPNNPSRTALQSEVGFLVKKGVFGQNLMREDFMDLLDTGLWKKLGKGAVQMGNVATLPNMLADNMNRYTAFKSEQAKLYDMYPTADKAILTDQAANRVRDTLPTYSQIPNVVKGASRVGMLNTFVSFPYELARNTLNSYKLGYQDIRQGMQQGNGKAVAYGAKRIAAMTAVLGTASAFGLSKATRTMNGVTDQQDQDLRTLLPSWLKTRELGYTSPIKDGKATYFNTSYLLPYSDLMAPINQGIRAIQQTGDYKSALTPVLSALQESFVGTPMVLSAWAGAIMGRDPATGKTISPIGATATMGDRAGYLWNKAYEPEVARWAANTAKGIEGQEGNYGQKFDLDNQMWRIGGVRAQTTDIANNLAFRMRDLAGQLDDIESAYRGNSKKNLPPAQLQQTYAAAEAQRQQLVSQAKQTYGAGARLLADQGGANQVLTAMKQAHMDPRTILDVADGTYTPMDQAGKPSAQQLYAQMQQMTRDAQTTKLAQVYRDDPTLGRTLIGLFKQDMRGMDEKDKIIASLGEGNGERANYIRQRMGQMATPLAQQTFLYSMAQKKILTKEVMQQLAK